MKIILDIPDSILPDNVKIAINQGNLTEKQHRLILRTILFLFCDEFDDCKIGVDEYRLVLKEDSRR